MSIREKAKLLFSSIFNFLSPFIRLFLSDSGRLLASVALDVVRELATTTATGEEKRKIALTKIQEAMRVRGVELAISTINAAIEAAYQKYLSQD
jgi:predicted GNAT family acetyltransferase